MMRPLVESYRLTSILTLSPGSNRMKFFRIFPEMYPRTTSALSNLTLNMPLGRDSVMEPSWVHFCSCERHWMLVLLLELVNEWFFLFDCCLVLTKRPLACFINFACLLTNTGRGSANELEVLQDVGVGEQAVIAVVAGAGFHHERDAIVARSSLWCTITNPETQAISQLRRRNHCRWKRGSK